MKEEREFSKIIRKRRRKQARKATDKIFRIVSYITIGVVCTAQFYRGVNSST